MLWEVILGRYEDMNGLCAAADAPTRRPPSATTPLSSTTALILSYSSELLHRFLHTTTKKAQTYSDDAFQPNIDHHPYAQVSFLVVVKQRLDRKLKLGLLSSGILGYGYELSHFYHAINHHEVKAIIFDAGSTDPGPSMLGSGETLCSRSSIARDLVPVLKASYNRKIKVLIGSAGGAGLNSQVDDLIDIMTEICQKENLPLKLAAIYSDIKRDLVTQKFKANLVEPCGKGPAPLTQVDIDDSINIVAQIGAEPFRQLLSMYLRCLSIMS